MGFLKKNPLTHAALILLPLSFTLSSPARSESQAPEFNLLRLEREFRTQNLNPSTPKGRESLFALAETRFDNHLDSALLIFQQLDRTKLVDSLDWLGLVYRIKAEPEQSAPLETRLRQMLANRDFFAVFDDRRSTRWLSPAGHHFEFREFIDRLEIDRDEHPFFTLQLG